MIFSKPQQYTAVVSSKVQVTKQVYHVLFTLQNPPTLDFIAGQTFMIRIAEGINRTMSIASPPSVKDAVFMCHDVSPMGPGSKWTIGLRIGDTVSFMAPLGRFVVDRESPRKKVLIATGTGVVPFRSMVLDLYSSTNYESNLYTRTDSQFVDKVTLYWGLRYEEDIYWKDEFEALEKEYPNFHFALTLSKPSDAWTGRKGRITDHVFTEETNLTDSDFYLCGNKQMVSDMRELLRLKGVPQEQVKFEPFF